MKLKEGFILRQLCKEYIVVAEGLQNVDFNKMIVLNETAAFLWNGVLGKDFTVEDLTNLLLGRYDVEEERAALDSKAIAQSWIDAGLAE